MIIGESAKRNSLIREILYWIFRIGFLVQTGFCIAMLFFNYVSTDERGWYFTVRGNFSLIDEHWRPAKSYVNIAEDGSEPIVLLSKSGFARFDYYDLSKAFSATNILLTFLEIFKMFLWLLFTYNLYRIFQSLRVQTQFDDGMLRRMRWLAVIVGVNPMLTYLHSSIFAGIISTHLFFDHALPGREFASASLLSGICMMILMLVLVEIFRQSRVLNKKQGVTF